MHSYNHQQVESCLRSRRSFMTVKPLHPNQSPTSRLEKWIANDISPPNDALPPHQEHLPNGLHLFARKIGSRSTDNNPKWVKQTKICTGGDLQTVQNVPVASKVRPWTTFSGVVLRAQHAPTKTWGRSTTAPSHESSIGLTRYDDDDWLSLQIYGNRSTPDRVVRVPVLPGDIVLHSWARHLIFMVPLSTQVYK